MGALHVKAVEEVTCAPCEKKRAELKEAVSQAAFIKAAKIAMEGMAMMAGKKEKGDE